MGEKKKYMDALQIALRATRKNDAEASKPVPTETHVSKMESVVWGDSGDVNMNLPVDGWNAKHWRRYFGMHYKLVYGQIYTGNRHQDNQAISGLLFRARHELYMSNAEIKEYLDWVAKNKLTYAKNVGRLYFIALLKEDLGEFYHYEIHPRKLADEQGIVKRRDLLIDHQDLRVSITKHIKKDEQGQILEVDPRLFMQLGIPIMAQYLMKQEGLSSEETTKIIYSNMQQIVQQDIGACPGAIKTSPRFERVIRASVEWEPYPWQAVKWRESGLRGLIDYFKYPEMKWWTNETPQGIKAATCLKTLCSKKKSL